MDTVFPGEEERKEGGCGPSSSMALFTILLKKRGEGSGGGGLTWNETSNTNSRKTRAKERAGWIECGWTPPSLSLFSSPSTYTPEKRATEKESGLIMVRAGFVYYIAHHIQPYIAVSNCAADEGWRRETRHESGCDEEEKGGAGLDGGLCIYILSDHKLYVHLRGGGRSVDRQDAYLVHS